MIILISSETGSSNEIDHIEEILGRFPEIRFHLRKPTFNKENSRRWLNSIEPCFLNRISIHQDFELLNEFLGIRLHKKSDSQDLCVLQSTSFHTLAEARQGLGEYNYFFCSPVFQSISKSGYHSSEIWSVKSESEEFREKAVALGGISSGNIGLAAGLGFKNVALLGAIWNSKNPLEAMQKIYSICQEFDLIA